MRKNGQKVSKNRMKKDSKATRIVTGCVGQHL